MHYITKRRIRIKDFQKKLLEIIANKELTIADIIKKIYYSHSHIASNLADMYHKGILERKKLREGRYIYKKAGK